MKNENSIRMAGTLVDLLDGMGYSQEETLEVTALMRRHLTIKEQQEDVSEPPKMQYNINLN